MFTHLLVARAQMGTSLAFHNWRRKRMIPWANWLLCCVVITSPAAFLALELGWMVTEEGR
jgi:cytochrome bd-type quinol oxidase subunit 1